MGLAVGMDLESALAPFVTRLVSYDEMGSAGTHRGLPSTGVTLVLPLDDPIDVAWASTTNHHISWSLLTGLHTEPAQIHYGRRQRGIQVTLTVGGVRALFGVPASALCGELTDLADVAPALRELPERLHSERSWAKRRRLVRTALLASYDEHATRRTTGEIGRALSGLTRGLPVSDVAAEVGYSRRRLSTLVRDETGVTPKQWARLARFERSKARLSARPHERLADVAAATGYSDHAHLTREWVEFAGCSPRAWVAEEFPNLQAPTD